MTDHAYRGDKNGILRLIAGKFCAVSRPIGLQSEGRPGRHVFTPTLRDSTRFIGCLNENRSIDACGNRHRENEASRFSAT
jgi:hypothetical protein